MKRKDIIVAILSSLLTAHFLTKQCSDELASLRSNLFLIQSNLLNLTRQVYLIQKDVSLLKNSTFLKNKESSIEDKIKTLIKSVNHSLNEKDINLITNAFISASKDYKVPLPILLAVAWQESHFKVDVMSEYGCIGIMQVNPKFWSFDLPYLLLFKPDINIRIGAYVLRYYYEQEGNWSSALERYYGKSYFGKRYRKMVLEKVRIISNILKGGNSERNMALVKACRL